MLRPNRARAGASITLEIHRQGVLVVGARGHDLERVLDGAITGGLEAQLVLARGDLQDLLAGEAAREILRRTDGTAVDVDRRAARLDLEDETLLVGARAAGDRALRRSLRALRSVHVEGERRVRSAAAGVHQVVDLRGADQGDLVVAGAGKREWRKVLLAGELLHPTDDPASIFGDFAQLDDHARRLDVEGQRQTR